MLTHSQIWSAIDALALRFDLSPSGLAKKAGLDPTSFNKSKRKTSDGRERWPSTESLSKILQATHTSLDDFVQLISTETVASGNYLQLSASRSSLSSETVGGFHEEHKSQILTAIQEKDDSQTHVYKLAKGVAEPFYRAGDTLILSSKVKVKVGDRVLITFKDESILIATIRKLSDKQVEVLSFSQEKVKRKINLSEIVSMFRILWVSQ